MPIQFDEKTKIFSIHTPGSTYAMQLLPYSLLTHLYYGERITDGSDLSYLVNTGSVSRAVTYNEITYEEFEGGASRYCPHAVRQEYSTFGIGDFRTPCLQGRFADGSSAVDLRFYDYRIEDGKFALEGLPAVYANPGESAQTLIITLKDKVQELYVELQYGIIEGKDQIMRSARICNRTGKDFYVTSALSMNLDIPGKDMDVLTYYGRPTNERFVERTPVRFGKISTESTAGITSNNTGCAMILCDRGADEEHGRCYGAVLEYSGNFYTSVELDHAERMRMTIGINPTNFCWKLEDGESFQTPEVILNFSKDGLAGLSHGFHDIIRYNVCRGKWKTARRPIPLNSWEALVYEFDEDKLVELARGAKKFGADMLVVDDGWFGHRDWDNSSLGDWTEDRKKLPNGMQGLCRRINELGVQLGVWFEPEMISEDSDLYRAHPDYCISIPGRPPMRGRWQLVLDMTRKEVRDCIFDQMYKILSSCPIAYIKWDMNRNLTDVYSSALPADRQGEVYHRYVLGVYELLERIHQAFPDLLIESCSGGGGRYDAGMMYYSPQIWCSDNTDPAHRMKIQYGSSLVYPISTVGSHIAYSPNINTYHPTTVFTRGVAAMAGTYGFELDPALEDETATRDLARMTALYKKHYDTINYGTYYRLISPYEQTSIISRASAWEFVSKDQKTALFSMIQMDNVNGGNEMLVRLRGLDPKRSYSLHTYYETRDDKVKPFTPWIEERDDGVFTGEVLMKIGLHLNMLMGDQMATFIELTAVE